MARLALTFVALALAGGCGVAVAQDAPPPPPPASPAPPYALPDDMPPPPMAAMLRPPRPDSQRPPEPPRENIPAPTRKIALAAAEAALAQCTRDGHEVGVAVSDSGGHLLLGMTMDGARPGRIYSGVRKNGAAVLFGRPTSQIQARLQAGDAAARERLKPWMVVFPGAVPLIRNGVVIGSVGVSGATAQQDEACAAAGVAAVQGQL